MENLEVNNSKNNESEKTCSSGISMSENPIEVVEQIEEEVRIAPSTQKKRGRKKKSEQVVTEESSAKICEPDIEVESRSGRKRKSVNYFALANPDINSDDDIPLKRVQVSIKEELTSMENSSESKRIKEKTIFPESVTKTMLAKSVNVKKEVNDVNIDTQILKSVGLKRGNTSGDESLTTDIQDLSDDWDKQEEETYFRKDKTYRKSGNTTEMLNTLFSQVDFHEDLPKGAMDAKVKIEKISTPKRGRKPKNATASVEKNASKEIDNEGSGGKKSVVCAICTKELEKNNWVHHKQRYHNNLAWRVGDPPLDLTNMDLVKQILNALYMNKKLFYCEKCDKSVKSVNGYLSHKSVCGKTTEDAKVPCKYCNKKMLPVSLPSHIRHYHENPKGELVKAKKKKEATILANAKRKAAEKALKVIKYFKMEASGIHNTFTKYFEELDFISSSVAQTMLQKQIMVSKRIVCKYPECSFECFTAEDIKQHLKFCMNKPEMGYVCKHCLFVQLNIADIICHIETVHGVIIDTEDEEVPQRTDKDKKGKRKQIMEKEKAAPKRTPFYFPNQKRLDMIFENSYSWTLDFCEKYYSDKIPEEHFPCLKKNWEPMNGEDIEEYLPKMGYSCDVGFETVVGFQDVLHKDHTFRKFYLFESYLENNGNSTIFCGGPINAMAWLPTPFTENGVHQIVAVATKNHPDDKFAIDSNYNEKCIVQFWDVGPLNNSDTSMYRPRLGSCLSFEFGPIWHLEWCPSNCFDVDEPDEGADKLRRMGVLAIAGSDSAVYIYSVPFFKQNGQFYNSRPVLKLVPTTAQDLAGSRKFYTSRVSWSKASGHKYIAVGYTNGMVALYNLWSTSKILRSRDANGVDALSPYKSFQAHCHYISAISLFHLNDGCRWLLTGSYDRAVSLWDLNDTSSAIQTVKRNIVNDALWMTNWLCHVICHDEASTTGPATTVIQQARDFLSDPLYLFHCSAAITCLSGSDWLNGIMQANAVGEIFATFPKQLLINLNWKYLKNKKLLFGYTTLVEKDKTISERLKENSDKEKALRNQLTVKTVLKGGELPANKEVTHLDYNPHYYEYEPLVYHEVEAKYSLLFCDHKMKALSDFPPTLQDQMSCSSKAYASSKPNIYPLQAINKIAFNPNRQATTHYLAGYQAGFVRLTCMKFLNKDPQIVLDNTKFNK